MAGFCQYESFGLLMMLISEYFKKIKRNILKETK